MKISRTLKTIIKIIIAVGFYIGLYFLTEENFQKIKDLDALSTNVDVLMLFFAVCLVPLNWFLEALKWKISVSVFERISLKTSIKGVLMGIPPSVFTPNRVGEALGRPVVLNPENRFQGVWATAYCGLSQMPVMMFFAVVACLFFKFSGRSFADAYFLSQWWFIFLGAFLTIFLAAVFMFPQYFIPFVRKKQNHESLLGKLVFFCNYKKEEKIRLLWFSALRYVVYSTQNYLSIRAFGVDFSYLEGMMSVFLIYALMSFVPRPALLELGVRCSATVLILKNYVSDFSAPTISSVFLWGINLLFPALLGTFLFLLEKNTKKSIKKFCRFKNSI